MAKRKKRRARRKPEYPGWVWMLFGLAIGLSVAYAVYMKDSRPAPQSAERQPASLDSALDDNGESAVTVTEADSERTDRFDFYKMLPNFEVIVPESEPQVSHDNEPKAVEEPGLYVLQAGSFTLFEDADRRRAELALHGIESRIQRVKVNDKPYHRVLIGPTDDLDELNMLRSRLRAAKIDVWRIRLDD